MDHYCYDLHGNNNIELISRIIRSSYICEKCKCDNCTKRNGKYTHSIHAKRVTGNLNYVYKNNNNNNNIGEQSGDKYVEFAVFSTQYRRNYWLGIDRHVTHR